MWNNIKTVLLLGALTGLMLLAGVLLGGRAGLLIALVFSLLMNLGTYWFSDKIVLSMYKAKKADKKEYAQLHKLIEEIAHEAKIPKPKVYIIPTMNPNAFATGRNPSHAAVACTQGILSLLDKDELKGVLAHEIGHIKHRDILVTTIAATIAAVISYLAMMARFAAIFGGSRDDRGSNIFGVLMLAILTPIIAMMLQLAISRSREYMADAASAKITKKPKYLAEALKKLELANKARPLHGNPATSSLFIVNPFSAQGLAALLSTHPPMKERIRRLEEMKL
ncbi:zinc metalloprotease HtpX [Candidatus Woesearchaeota archaeon]|nr:zinc metalloprotease HtpX [Candidatus Woesearchaeota archaeon]